MGNSPIKIARTSSAGKTRNGSLRKPVDRAPTAMGWTRTATASRVSRCPEVRGQRPCLTVHPRRQRLLNLRQLPMCNHPRTACSTIPKALTATAQTLSAGKTRNVSSKRPADLTLTRTGWTETETAQHASLFPEARDSRISLSLRTLDGIRCHAAMSGRSRHAVQVGTKCLRADARLLDTLSSPVLDSHSSSFASPLLIMVTARQQKILSLLIEDYVSTVAPVGSETIVRKHDLGVSSATVRNELAELEEAGYISRPHPSSGAVPEDRAYRMYVESLSGSWQDGPPLDVRQSVRDRLIQAEGDVDSWASAAAELLAGLVGNMAVATFPISVESRVRHFELVRIQDLTALLILVFGQARLGKHLIRLPRPLEQSDLDAIGARVKGRILGLSKREILSLERDNRTSDFEDDLLTTTASILDTEDKSSRRDHYVDGLKNLLNQPELSEGDSVRAVVGSLEDGSLMHAILDASPDEGTVKVIIGQENEGDFLRPFTVVICGYGVPGQAFGIVSALGPRRMEYSRTISGVRFVSNVMSELVEGVTA